MPPLIGLGGEAPSGVIALSLVVASAMALVMYSLGAGLRSRVAVPEMAPAR